MTQLALKCSMKKVAILLYTISKQQSITNGYRKRTKLHKGKGKCKGTNNKAVHLKDTTKGTHGLWPVSK